VGYTGGTKLDPTYYDLGDHAEAFQVDYDPQKISYEQLLAVFWGTHNPCEQADSRQYMSAAFYQTEAQQRLALATREREARRRSLPLATVVLPLGRFYLAEDYHQKYRLRHEEGLWREFESLYPDAKVLIASTAAARINGYLGGYGSEAQFREELPGLGLSRRGRNLLQGLWEHRPKLTEALESHFALTDRDD
jgi:peptide-methionine (S)-S-oxide reductase